MRQLQLTAIIERDTSVGGFVSLCPQLDIASQGDTVEEAKYNLTEAIELFFEVASSSEVSMRMQNELFITQIAVPIPATRQEVVTVG